MEEKIVLGILILASVTVFIVSLYIVIPALMSGNKVEIEEKRRKELDKFLMSKGVIKKEEDVPKEA